MAKLEWTLYQIYEDEDEDEDEDEELDTCLCGHYPIKEICILQNQKNGQFATVGNCCVKKFIGLPSDKIFQAVKRIRKDSSKSLSIEAINHAFEKGWINRWEHGFSIDTIRKRKLSSKQIETRHKINAKMLANMQRP